MNEGGGGGGRGGLTVEAVKPPLRQLERNPLLVIHALKRSAAYLDQAPHVIGLQDGSHVIKLPNGASILPLRSGALMHPRGVRQQLKDGTSNSAGTVQAGDHLLDYRLRVGDSEGADEGLNTVVRSRIWDIGFGPLGPVGSLLADAMGGGARGSKGPPLAPSGFAAAQRGLVHAVAKDPRGVPRPSSYQFIGQTGSAEFNDSLTPQAVRLEFAARRLQALGEKRVALAGTSLSPLDAWPRSVTSLVETWWVPYLRPAAMRAPTKAAKRKMRKLEAAQPDAGAQVLPGVSAQAAEEARMQAQMDMQAQYDAQMAAQEFAEREAEREARREATQTTKEWLKQAWLLSNVRSTLYYTLRGMDEEEEDVPLLRAGLNSVPMALPREAPQESFVAGYPDAVQEIYTQAPLELCAIPEGLTKPAKSSELQVKGPDGEKKRPTLTAQVTRIRGSAASAFGFAGLGGDLQPTLLPLGQTILNPLGGNADPNSALAA